MTSRAEAGARTTPSRILIGKAGMDKHDRGVLVVARALRDAGFEVVYVGPGRSAEEIARMALDEDVAAIGLSLLSGAHLEVFADLRATLDALGISDLPLFAGGTIPAADLPALRALGVADVYTPGTPLERIVEGVTRLVAPR